MDFIKKPEITDAIKSLRPTSTFCLVDDKYSTLVWNDTENTKPTESEVNAKLTELTTQWEAKEYPDIGDQLDDLYAKGAFSDEMSAKIKAVKDKYPKE